MPAQEGPKTTTLPTVARKPRALPKVVVRALSFARAHRELIAVVAIAYVVMLFSSHFRSTSFNNYTRLADAWRHGHIWIDWPGRWLDAALYNGKYYTVDAPFPAVVMMPLVLIYGDQANQTSVAIFVAAAIIGLARQLLARLGVTRVPRLFLLLFLFAGTDVWWCAELGDVWFMAHLCAMAATFGAFLELSGRRRGWVVGLCAIAAVFSRNTELFSLAFFAYALATGDLARLAAESRGETFANTLEVRKALRAFGALLSLGFLAWIGYNEASWGTFYDIGHTLYFHQDSWGKKDGSPFGLSYLPYQLYSFFIRGPELVQYLQQAQWPVLNVDNNGVALTFTSPALLLAFLARQPARLVVACWLAAIFVAAPDFLYYLNGWYQFGMRHALDFEPYLFVLMALAARKRMPAWAYGLCVYSAVVGAWGVWWWNLVMRTGD
jgi:hypothetical protein